MSGDEKLVVSGSADCTIRVWNIETGFCVRVIQHVNSARLNAFELLSIAFGRAENDGDADGVESKNADLNVFCIVGKREILVRKNSDGDNSEPQVLGTLHSKVYCWAFDAKRKRLCVGLRDGTVALVRIADKEF